MANYARAAERAYRQELARMGHCSRHERLLLMRGVRQWFRGDPEGRDHQAQRDLALAEIYGRNQKLRTFVEFREDLSAIWERSNASREQLLSQLQDWCRRAEQSGINALEEFSLRLRRYA
jgi:stearoyl-CoA desaturase (Delta-9 desaturase)